MTYNSYHHLLSFGLTRYAKVRGSGYIAKVLSTAALAALFAAAPCQTALGCTFVTSPPAKVPPTFSVWFYRGLVPMPNANVVVRGDAAQELLRSTTDASGLLTLSHLKPGPYTIDILEDGVELWGLDVEVSTHAEWPIPIVRAKLPPRPKLHEPVLLRGLRGTLFDENGAVIVGATVTVEAPESASIRKVSLTTDQRGEFSSALPEGHYLLTFQARYFSVAKLPVDVAHTAPRGWEAISITLQVERCTLYPDPNRFTVSELPTKIK